MSIERGNLDRRIQFRRYTETDDGFGVVQSWADHGSVIWASKTDVSDGERWRANEVSAIITARFAVRYSTFTAALTPKDRLVCDSAEYDISGIKEVQGRRRWLEITAAARADAMVAPANVTVPIITGAAQVGETLTVSDGVWGGDPIPALAYAWFADAVEIEGAVAASYELTAGEDGAVITATVTASNSAGSVTVETVPTDVVVEV